MADNILTKDRDGASIALSAKDIGGILAPRNIITDPAGNDITPLTDSALRASPVVVSVENFPASSGGQTDSEMRAAPIEVISSDSTFLESIAFRALAKLTYTLTGQRVDCGGSSVAVSSLPTLANVTALAGIGYNTQNGQAIQQSQLSYQCGFRRNLT